MQGFHDLVIFGSAGPYIPRRVSRVADRRKTLRASRSLSLSGRTPSAIERASSEHLTQLVVRLPPATSTPHAPASGSTLLLVSDARSKVRDARAGLFFTTRARPTRRSAWSAWCTAPRESTRPSRSSCSPRCASDATGQQHPLRPDHGPGHHTFQVPRSLQPALL